MANEEHLAILKQGVGAWNQWRDQHRDIRADIRGADLSGMDLEEANLQDANLMGAHIVDANLCNANLRGADLREVYLHSFLRGADLSGADLRGTVIHGMNVSGANLSESIIGWTVLGDIDLRGVLGLETIRHVAPSTLGIDIIYSSNLTVAVPVNLSSRVSHGRSRGRCRGPSSCVGMRMRRMGLDIRLIGSDQLWSILAHEQLLTGISWGTGMLEMRMPPILRDLNVCMHLKEILMIRRAVTFVLLTCLGGLSPGPLAVANESAGRYSVYPRVVATVLTLAPRGIATIQTSEGARYEVVRGTGWQVGDTVTCEHRATGRPSWQALECRKTS